MQILFNKDIPIYTQIIDEIKKQIGRGHLQSGSKLPSQRELAAELKVNPNTIQRVYREMEQGGIIETRRGQGTFIVEDRSLVERMKKRLVDQYCCDFLSSMEGLGFTLPDILKILQQYKQGGNFGNDGKDACD